MSFQFNFSGDDIDNIVIESHKAPENTSNGVNSTPANEPKFHSIRSLIKPSLKISYSTIALQNDQIILPKRDLFDVKYQLMSQEEELSSTDQILLGLTNEDIRTYTYEGGLKVWECTNDLLSVIKHMFSPPTISEKTNILELGCGAALPSAYAFKLILQHGIANVKLTMADYNQSVLMLVTIPNMILAWLSALNLLNTDTGEIEITDELLTKFEADLSSRGIELEFVSGAWSPQFVELLKPALYRLILASETIYSLETLPMFTDVMLDCMDAQGQALIAAKKIYFGVGGGIPDFLDILSTKNVHYQVVADYSTGVGRSVIQVTKNKPSAP